MAGSSRESFLHLKVKGLKVQEGEPATRPRDSRATYRSCRLSEAQPACGPAGLLMVPPVDLTQMGNQRARESNVAAPRSQSAGDRNRVEKARE